MEEVAVVGAIGGVYCDPWLKAAAAIDRPKDDDDDDGDYRPSSRRPHNAGSVLLQRRRQQMVLFWPDTLVILDQFQSLSQLIRDADDVVDHADRTNAIWLVEGSFRERGRCNGCWFDSVDQPIRAF